MRSSKITARARSLRQCDSDGSPCDCPSPSPSPREERGEGTCQNVEVEEAGAAYALLPVCGGPTAAVEPSCRRRMRQADAALPPAYSPTGMTLIHLAHAARRCLTPRLDHNDAIQAGIPDSEGVFLRSGCFWERFLRVFPYLPSRQRPRCRCSSIHANVLPSRISLRWSACAS